MQRTLCFDFGNSRYKCGVMEDGVFIKEIILNGSADEIAQLLQQSQPHNTILASVINHDAAIEKVLSNYGHFIKVSSECNLNITVPSGQEKTVGADRWAMLSGAMAVFPKNHILIVGLGTCITFNFINKFHEFLGGAISPGLYMRLKALRDYTALLPLEQPNWNFPLIGYDTKTNIQSGVILGMSKEIDGVIEEYRQRYSNLKVMITGGDMSFFHNHIKSDIMAEPYLIYKGLYHIAQNNL